MHKYIDEYLSELRFGFANTDPGSPRIAMVRNRVDGGGLCIAANELANALYHHGYAVEVLVDRFHHKDAFVRGNLDSKIPIIPMMQGGRRSDVGVREHQTLSIPWYDGKKVMFFDQFSNHVKTSYTEPDGQRVRIDYPFLEAYLSRLKKNDIVMTFDASLSWHVGLADVPAGVKKVHQVHNQGFYWESLLDVSERFDRFVTLTKNSSTAYRKKYKTDGGNHTVIPNAVRVAPSRNMISYENRRQKIVFAGRITEAKGVDLAIRAFAQLPKKFSDFVFEIWGNGGYSEKLRALANELGVSDRVHFKGFGAPKEIFSDAILHVLPSKREAFGLVVVEAMQFGTPSVTTSTVFGLDEVILENNVGLVSETRDVDGFANLIETAIESTQWKIFSANCIENVAKYQKPVVYKQWVELLDELNAGISPDVFFDSRLARLEISSNLKSRIAAIYWHERDKAENILSFFEYATPKMIDGAFTIAVPEKMVTDLGKSNLKFPVDFM